MPTNLRHNSSPSLRDHHRQPRASSTQFNPTQPARWTPTPQLNFPSSTPHPYNPGPMIKIEGRTPPPPNRPAPPPRPFSVPPVATLPETIHDDVRTHRVTTDIPWEHLAAPLTGTKKWACRFLGAECVYTGVKSSVRRHIRTKHLGIKYVSLRCCEIWMLSEVCVLKGLLLPVL